jgi:serine phosphatase RsbU (regulator of sigma subunit)
MILSRTGSRPQFDEGDLAVTLALAQRAAVAVDNAMLYEHETEVAQVLQRGLLPPALPSVPGVEVAAAYRPAAEDVGGDFYDLWPMANGVWGFSVGDVCGIGADAAAFNAVARATLRALSISRAGPAAWLRGLNAALLLGPDEPAQSERFCTVVAGTLRLEGEGARLRVATGGHLPPILRRPGSAPAAVRVSGTLLGAFDEVRIGELDLRLEPGDQLVLYTDGVIDTVGQAERFGEERLAQTLRDAAGAADAVRRIERALVEFAHGSQVDDTAVIAVERLPGEPGGGGRARGNRVRVARN